FLERALELYRRFGDRYGEGQVLANMGLAYSQVDDNRRAIEHYEQALNICRITGNRFGEATILGNMGVAYEHLLETNLAIKSYEEQLALAREIKARRLEA